ncbi:MAG: hypothetical protein EAX86_13275, partial [Candidatus Heimdallarchaeota archaeon]|nr:hypothetical protein [Candidatus Heimdallarchaeota archaeon]
MNNLLNESILVDLTEVYIRPVKVLWLIPPSKDLSTFKKLCSVVSRLWGGVGHCMVPQIDFPPNSPWYSIIKKYDPDIFVYDDSVSTKAIVPHNMTAFSLTYSNIDKNAKEGFTSTFGLGMNLHKFERYMKFNYSLVHKKNYYWHIVLGDPPSKYEDYDINGNKNDYRYVYYTEDVSVFFHHIPPSIEAHTIQTYKNSMKSHRYRRNEGYKRDIIYNIRDATTIGLVKQLDKIPKEYMNSYFDGNIVVVGDYKNIETIALYWNLRISFRNTFLLCQEKIIKDIDILIKEKAIISLISIEISLSILKEIKTDLMEKFDNIKIEILTLDQLHSIPFQKYCWDRLGIALEPITIVSNEIKTSLRTVNEFLNELYATVGKINFVTELRFKSKKFPKRMILSELFDSSRRTRVTSSNDLAIYLSDEDISPTLGNAHLTRSFTFSLSFPTPLTILETICLKSLKNNFQKVELSNLGKLTTRFIHLAGSLEETIRLINNEGCLEIVSAFIRRKKDKNQTLVKDDFSYNGLINQIKKSKRIKLFEEQLFRDGLLELIKKEYIIQGLTLKCTSCSNKDWYHLEGITNNYKCNRCGSNNFVGLKPNWAYRLNQLVFNVLSESSNLTLETIIDLKSISQKSFEFIPEFEIYYTNRTNERKKYEIDLFVIKDGKLIIGETKQSLYGFDTA